MFGEEIVGLNASKTILQSHRRSGDGQCRHSGDIGASQGIGYYEHDCVVTSRTNIIFTMWRNSKSHYYKCVGKTGQRMELNSSEQAMSWPFVCGVDSTGAVLVADCNNKTFQVHETDDQ